jgi:protein-S-isoprenylcysteine O-methyltransferase Ste14
MTTAERVLAYAVMALAVTLGAGSLALFVMGAGGWVQMGWPLAGALAWDAGLSLVFFVQHSGMVRQGFRERTEWLIPQRYQQAVYAIASGVALAMVALLWQPAEVRLFTFEGAWRWAPRLGVIAAAGLFFWSAVALKSFDGFGLEPILARLRGVEPPRPVFVVRGPYRWVRHPWYLCALLLIWSVAEMTAGRLLFAVLWSAWIWIGARLEERDLVREFGEPYAEYRRRVPMLIPWRFGAASFAGAGVRAAGSATAH